jgi:hypothetical protein
LDRNGVGVGTVFPFVYTTHWCGEHEPAEPGKPEKPDAGAQALELLREVGKLDDPNVCEWVKFNPGWAGRVSELLRESGEGAK